jgi:hypothetical protein
MLLCSVAHSQPAACTAGTWSSRFGAKREIGHSVSSSTTMQMSGGLIDSLTRLQSVVLKYTDNFLIYFYLHLFHLAVTNS